VTYERPTLNEVEINIKADKILMSIHVAE